MTSQSRLCDPGRLDARRCRATWLHLMQAWRNGVSRCAREPGRRQQASIRMSPMWPSLRLSQIEIAAPFLTTIPGRRCSSPGAPSRCGTSSAAARRRPAGMPAASGSTARPQPWPQRSPSASSHPARGPGSRSATTGCGTSPLSLRGAGGLASRHARDGTSSSAADRCLRRVHGRYKLRKDGTIFKHNRRKSVCAGTGTLPRARSVKRKWPASDSHKSVQTISGGAVESDRRRH